MRSVIPDPNNSWPHDMTLSVEDRPQTLLDLLWMREAHGFYPRGEHVPPLLIDGPDYVSVAADEAIRAEWERAWPLAWQEAVEHVGQVVDPRKFDQIRETPDGSPERAALLRELAGPDVRERFGEDVFQDSSYRKWSDDGMEAFISSRPRALAESPERRDLDALIPAWRAGLTKIVTIPCRGTHNRRIGAHGLLVTDRTRADSDNYRQALADFV